MPPPKTMISRSPRASRLSRLSIAAAFFSWLLCDYLRLEAAESHSVFFIIYFLVFPFDAPNDMPTPMFEEWAAALEACEITLVIFQGFDLEMD